EAVHQEALAAPDAAVHVDAARNFRPVDQLLEDVGALLPELCPLTRAAIQRLDRLQLRRVAAIAPRGEFGFVDLADGRRHAWPVRPELVEGLRQAQPE